MIAFRTPKFCKCSEKCQNKKVNATSRTIVNFEPTIQNIVSGSAELKEKDADENEYQFIQGQFEQFNRSQSQVYEETNSNDDMALSNETVKLVIDNSKLKNT